MRRKILFLMILGLGIGLGGDSLMSAGERVGEQFIAGPVSVVSTTLVSVSSGGQPANGDSSSSSISGNGRFVAFSSMANNLVAGDNNNSKDVFVHDRQTGATTRVSLSSNGAEGNLESRHPSISWNGRFVAFNSDADNLVVGDNNNAADIFVYDRQTATTTRVSVSSNGVEGTQESLEPSISGDGRFVAFESTADNLVEEDHSTDKDVFVHDRQTSATSLVSVSSDGAVGNGSSRHSSISGNGRYVAFSSMADNLVGEGDIPWLNVFVHDRQTGATSLVSAPFRVGGRALNGYNPSTSGDGRFVAFSSGNNFLVVGDNNPSPDIFVFDRQTGVTTPQSLSLDGAFVFGSSDESSISGDGRFVTFHSSANNLVAGDNDGRQDAFISDRQTGAITRLSVSSNGAGGNLESARPSISRDGRFVAFQSKATNLVVGDNNGTQDIFVAELNWDRPAQLDNPIDRNLPEGARNEDLPLAPQLPPEPGCLDSDGGQKPKIFGQVSGTIADPNRQEGRASRYVLQDRCCGKSYLREYFCEGDDSRVQWYRCNCRKGECLKGLWPMPIDRRQAPRECAEDLF